MSQEPISVIKVRNVLLVTMLGDPDDATVAALQDRTLDAMSKHDVPGLVLEGPEPVPRSTAPVVQHYEPFAQFVLKAVTRNAGR